MQLISDRTNNFRHLVKVFTKCFGLFFFRVCKSRNSGTQICLKWWNIQDSNFKIFKLCSFCQKMEKNLDDKSFSFKIRIASKLIKLSPKFWMFDNSNFQWKENITHNKMINVTCTLLSGFSPEIECYFWFLVEFNLI